MTKRADLIESFIDRVDILLEESRGLCAYSQQLLKEVRATNSRDWRADHALPKRAL
jgi:hypothetical protein